MAQRSVSLSIDDSRLAPLSEIANPGGPHDLECLIQRGLQAYPGLKFSRLTVHKCPQGVCLEGLLESNEGSLDLCDLVNEIAGVQAINHVVMRPKLPK